MSEHFKQNCVLCGQPAEYCFADYRKRKHFLCDYCTEYQITDSAEKKLATAPQEWRSKCSEKAKSVGPDRVLAIFLPNVQKTEGVAYESLRGEPTRREDLPKCG